MDSEERAQFEENLADLVDAARTYGVILEVGNNEQVEIKGGTLGGFYSFYQDWRSEIEEVI